MTPSLETLEKLANYCKEVAEDGGSEKQYARALEPLNAAANPQTVLDLIREIRALRGALEFYAEKSNWVSRSGKIGICPVDTIDRESFGPEYPWAGGKRAREALKGTET